MTQPKPRLVYAATAGITARTLMRGQLRFMAERYDVTVITSPDKDLEAAAAAEGVDAIGVPMSREIHPVHDFVSLLRMIRVLRRIRPDIVNAGTPKAALLALIAATVLRVPVRIYLQRGLRLETTRGLKHFVLTLAERLTSACAHQVYAVSESLREEYVRRRLTKSGKIRVLRHGSSNGVNAQRFFLKPEDETALAALRQSLALPEGVPVIGFIGRLTRDKGVAELLEAFRLLEHPQARLLLVGPFESDNAVDDGTRAFIRETPNIIHVPMTTEVRLYYHLFDVFAFPSYREGLPNVVLEAASAGVPTVGYRATGVRDAIVDGVTGALVDIGDARAMAAALGRYLSDGTLRRAHGDAARERAVRDFNQQALWQAYEDEYRRLLASARTSRQLPQ